MSSQGYRIFRQDPSSFMTLVEKLLFKKILQVMGIFFLDTSSSGIFRASCLMHNIYKEGFSS